VKREHPYLGVQKVLFILVINCNSVDFNMAEKDVGVEENIWTEE